MRHDRIGHEGRTMKNGIIAMATLCISLAGGAVAAPDPAPDSDPAVLGWMQGFPPAADKVIRPMDADVFDFPKRRWTMCHFRQLMPNVAVDRGPSATRMLPEALDPGIDAIGFVPTGSDRTMTWAEAFDANYTDGVIVLHHGRIVHEHYGGCLGPDSLHGAMSVTKSLTGLLAEILIAEGALDPAALIGDLVPELHDSAFGDATLRQVMDMTTTLDFSEDYADPEAEIWAYSRAGSSLRTGDEDGPEGYFAFLRTVTGNGPHGEGFGYRTVNSDALGWVIARAMRQSVAELLADRIWRRIGARREAFFTVDALGTPFAGGGFNATLRDMARLGQLMLDEGRLDDQQIIPGPAIAAIRGGGDQALFAKAGFDLPGWSYRSMWWITHDDHGAFAARGVHGQTIWVDPAADMVIARFASHPVAANAANDATSLPAFRAVADYLIAHDDAPLLGREWIIEDIAGGGVIDNTQPALHFLADGRLAGSTGCNRIIGEYHSENSRLTLLPAGTTMMACPEALMMQERRLLDLLVQIERFAVDETGALILTTKTGATLVARR